MTLANYVFNSSFSYVFQLVRMAYALASLIGCVPQWQVISHGKLFEHFFLTSSVFYAFSYDDGIPS